MNNIVVKVEDLPQTEYIFVDPGIENETNNGNIRSSIYHQQNIKVYKHSTNLYFYCDFFLYAVNNKLQLKKLFNVGRCCIHISSRLHQHFISRLHQPSVIVFLIFSFLVFSPRVQGGPDF